MKLIKAEETLAQTGNIVLIYGQPGTGKTTLAQTAGNCITLDFDRGIQRAAIRQDAARIESWDEIARDYKAFFEFLRPYDTIVVDTAGMMLDYMLTYITTKNPALLNNNIKLYGELKKEFHSAFFGLRNLGKDLLLIAHDKEEDENGIKIKRPLIPGSAKDIVLQACDMLGYLQNTTKGRILDFTPSPYYLTKNCIGLPQIAVPGIVGLHDWMAQFFRDLKKQIQARTESNQAAILQVAELCGAIAELQSAQEFTEFFATLPKDLIAPVKSQVWFFMQNAAQAAGLAFDAEKKIFVEAVK